MARENMFFENDNKSYTVIDLYLNHRMFLVVKIPTIIILTLIRYYYLKKS